MRRTKFAVSVAVLFVVGAAGASTPGTPAAKKYRLAFSPKDGATLRIQYVHDQAWDYPDMQMKGQLHTELVLDWTFGTTDGKRIATAKCGHVIYRGKGTKQGTPFDYDFDWTPRAAIARARTARPTGFGWPRKSRRASSSRSTTVPRASRANAERR